MILNCIFINFEVARLLMISTFVMFFTEGLGQYFSIKSLRSLGLNRVVLDGSTGRRNWLALDNDEFEQESMEEISDLNFLTRICNSCTYNTASPIIDALSICTSLQYFYFILT